MSEYFKFFPLQRKQYLTRNRVIAPNLRLINENLEHFTKENRLHSLHSSYFLMRQIDPYESTELSGTFPVTKMTSVTIYFYPTTVTKLVYYEMDFGFTTSSSGTGFAIKVKAILKSLDGTELDSSTSIAQYEPANPNFREAGEFWTAVVEEFYDFETTGTRYMVLTHKGQVLDVGLYQEKILRIDFEINVDAFAISDTGLFAGRWYLLNIILYENRRLVVRP